VNVNKYAKAIVAAVLSGGTAFESASGSTGHRLVLGLIAAVVTGVVTWGVPNQVVTELKTVVSTFDAPTQITPAVK
jgi:hypothetical protein